MTEYIYRGDRMTDPALKGQRCTAIRRAGKCLRGKNGNMLVRFEGGRICNVIGNQLRKVGT